jgi:nucleoside-diphosphate-sugar epimerase
MVQLGLPLWRLGRVVSRLRKKPLIKHKQIDRRWIYLPFAILLAIERARDKVSIFNLGTEEYCQVDDSIGWITQHLGVDPVRTYTGGERGWVGDSPFIFLDMSDFKKMGGFSSNDRDRHWWSKH